MKFQKLALLVLLFAVMVLILGCSTQSTGQLEGETFNYDIGVIPDDVCWADGAPVILNAELSQGVDFMLTYVRNDGDIVISQWTALNGPVQKGGEWFWTGGVCPESER